jgi:putative SOS response-associated peptidase YedK
MCGRASLTKTEVELEQRFGIPFYQEDIARYNPLPNYNIAPTHRLPVILNTDPGHWHFLKWGLVPYWAKEEKIGYKMINARSETIPDKPAFREAYKRRRCLIPLDGFYEWRRVSKDEKQAFWITLENEALFAVAGLWENWADPGGQTLQTFTIITTTPNALMVSIHDRMPAILKREDEETWLAEETEPLGLQQCLLPYPATYMKATPVGPAVNHVRENNAGLIQATGEVLREEDE